MLIVKKKGEKVNPTEEQQKVIDSKRGRIAVSACPGSGKTATLVKRTMALPEEELKLVLAFNKEAKDEFAKRLGNSNAQVMTFHSFCLREMSRNPLNYGFNSVPTIWERGLFNLIKVATNSMGRGWEDCGYDEDIVKACENGVYTDELDLLIEKSKPNLSNDDYSQMEKDLVNMVDAESGDLEFYRSEYKKEKQKRIEHRTYHAVKQMRNFLKNTDQITFDSMVRVVAENRHNLINKTDHVMVDEFQDVDRFQFDIIKTIGKSPDVLSMVVVGDPNQTIYKWRGALDNAFEEFLTSFKGSIQLRLTKNFRSHDEIIQYGDDICPVGMTGVRGSKEGAVLEVHGADLLRDFIKNQTSFKEFAILHRYNKDVESSKKQLMELDIPFFVIGKNDSFWSQKHVVMAEKARMRGMTFDRFRNNEEWLNLTMKKKYLENEDALKEITEDASFVMSLEISEINKMKNCVQNEKHGVRLSTIHKTKGREWSNVMVRNIDGNLMDDTFLYYVACTRARDFLLLDFA